MQDEIVRRTLELERRFLRPQRSELEPGLAALDDADRMWNRALATGRLPPSWADDTRRFRSGARVEAVPKDRQAARFYLQDPEGMMKAELAARTFVRALGLEPAPERIVWRLAGAAVDRPEAGEPSLGRAREPLSRLAESILRATGVREGHEHPHRRFRLVGEIVRAAVAREHFPTLRIPPDFGEFAGTRLGDLDDAFTPLIELWATGYWLWSVRDKTIELAAPFSPSSQAKKGEPVWSLALSHLRLAYVRGDLGEIRRAHARTAALDQLGHAPLIHFAVYGGAEALALFAELAADEPIDARDEHGRTALMIAAAMPASGPLGASERESAAPKSSSAGTSALEWLLSRGAELEASDDRGWTALHWAASASRPRSLERLVRAGANLEVRDHFGLTPLLVSLEAPEPIAVLDGLLAAGADPDVRDDQGWSALHWLALIPDEAQAGRIRRRLGSRAMPSRDRLGRSPADLAGGRASARALDPREPVAAGPGAWPPRPRARSIEIELTENPDRAGLEPRAALAVWADWLQSQGDRRGEVLAAELSGKRSATELSRLRRRLAGVTRRVLRSADPHSCVGNPRISAKFTRGFITMATVPLELGPASLVALLAHEPLLVDLALDGVPGLELGMPPAEQVRRLRLRGLPASTAIAGLSETFPRVRQLQLTGTGKLDHIRVDWPGLEALVIRHGDSSEWACGGRSIEVPPELRELDLTLPIGSRDQESEVAGLADLLARATRLQRLRLAFVAPAFIPVLLRRGILPELRELEFDPLRGQALAGLLDHLVRSTLAPVDRLERFSIGVTTSAVDQHRLDLEALRQRLPQLHVRVRA